MKRRKQHLLHSMTKEELQSEIDTHSSKAKLLKHLGLYTNTTSYRLLNYRIRVDSLDVSSMTGKGWNVGLNFKPSQARCLAEILVENSLYPPAKLRKRILAAGLKQEICEKCGLASWMGESIPLTIDHINGDPTDNRFSNLRILCPNCHAQTPTYCGRNKKSNRIK